MDQAGKTEVEDIHQPNAENRTPKTFEKHMGRGWDSERSTKAIFAPPNHGSVMVNDAAS